MPTHPLRNRHKFRHSKTDS